MRLRPVAALSSAALLMAVVATPASAIDDAHREQANAQIDKGIAFLRSTQNGDGSWSPDYGPAITALCVRVMLDHPEIGPDDPTVAKGVAYILKHANADGSIARGDLLTNYNTAIAVAALTRIDTPEVNDRVKRAVAYLKGLQWQEGMTDPDGKKITKDHPFYGGTGYGGSGRPDLSNMHMTMMAWEDAGVAADDPAVQRAMTFINRLQGVKENEYWAPDTIIQDGGFIYSTSINKDHIGTPESKASPELMKALETGKAEHAIGLRSYGSMTYAAFKSMVYANLAKDDPRVKAAWGWIGKNYTLEQNPGMPESHKYHGYFYYFMTFARALDAWGEDTIKTGDGERDWANDLTAKLGELQREDGSWVNEADRWNEGDANMVTAFAVIALQEAVD